MRSLTKDGQQVIRELAAKYNLNEESVTSLAKAIVRGNGSMAQFNIPELGGSGQWMKGGMTMVGDMFNNTLKATVDSLCSELSNLISTRVIFEDTGDVKTDLPNTGKSSWPSIFGSPTSTGSQNNIRYAYFAPAKRLVIDEDGNRKIYDTKHHRISGISQQQGSSNSFQFTSQDGPVDIGNLAVVSEHEEHLQETPEMVYDVSHSVSAQSENESRSPEDIIFATIEKLNVLFERGKITEEEFKTKKQELLAKL